MESGSGRMVHVATCMLLLTHGETLGSQTAGAEEDPRGAEANASQTTGKGRGAPGPKAGRGAPSVTASPY